MKRLIYTLICEVAFLLSITSCVKEAPAPAVNNPTFGKSVTIQVLDGKLNISAPVTLSSDFKYSSCGIRVEADGKKDYPSKVSNKAIAVSLDAFDYSGKSIKISSYFSSGSGSEITSHETTFSVPVLAKEIVIRGIGSTALVDNTYNLSVIPSPSGSDKNTFEWSSSNSRLATIDSKGVVRTVLPGTVTFTAKSKESGKSGSCSITLTEPDYYNLSENGTANCYIVSQSEYYKFKPTRGNTSATVGTISSVFVLWETFGTSVTPSVGDLVTNVRYSDGYVKFHTTSIKGNAVIAAKDESGKILWSWHIWLTDQPENQVYNNNAGIMMDRNLGATSATPGDVKALGLLYQWGRKDPFVSSSSISSNIKAATTIRWPSPVESTSSTGTIAYAVAHPTTFITGSGTILDWYYSNNGTKDHTRWQPSKTMYDPCPPGYRVPHSAVWEEALGTQSNWKTSSNWDSTNKGMNFGKTDKKLGSASTIWYPSSAERSFATGSLILGGQSGSYWSCSPDDIAEGMMAFFSIEYTGEVGFWLTTPGPGCSVRCLKE